jgi:molybdate transport system ATP-binding protein
MIKIDILKSMQTSEGKVMLDVRTQINRNELVCLSGHSGSGKTTLLRILAGLTKPDSGYIEVDGVVWFDSASKINLHPRKRNVGYMFQDYALFPNMSVESNIAFAQQERRPDEIAYLLHTFGLSELRKQKPHKLSGGQKQRVALARALAARPELLLLDEPLSALDYEMRQSLQQEVKKAHAMLNSVSVMVSHDPAEIRKLGTSVIVLRNGAVVSQGEAEEVFGKQHFTILPAV